MGGGRFADGNQREKTIQKDLASRLKSNIARLSTGFNKNKCWEKFVVSTISSNLKMISSMTLTTHHTSLCRKYCVEKISFQLCNSLPMFQLILSFHTSSADVQLSRVFIYPIMLVPTYKEESVTKPLEIQNQDNELNWETKIFLP